MFHTHMEQSIHLLCLFPGYLWDYLFRVRILNLKFLR